MPKITLATPVLNGAEYIGEAIESVLSQRLPDFEYIIVDAGSKDGTRDIVMDYVRRDARIRTIFEPDRGIYDAAFKGILAGTGSICGWLGSDDKLLPWAFELVVEAVEQRSERWVTGIPSIWDAQGRMVWVGADSVPPQALIRRGWHSDVLFGWIQQESTFFTRELFSSIPPERVAYIRTMRSAGDFVLWAELAKHAELRGLSTVIAGFRYHAKNTSANMTLFRREIREAGFSMPPKWLKPLVNPLRIGNEIFARVRRREHWSRIDRAARGGGDG